MVKSVLGILYISEVNHWWFRARRSITDFVYWKTKKKGLSILSIGCGTGSELESIQQYGNVTAIDIQSEAVQYCRNKGFSVIESDLLEFKPEQQYDVVVIMDVLEHIEDEEKAVNILYKLLKPGGDLLITVPACPFLWSVHDELGEYPHIRRYTYRSLKIILEKSGFIIKRLSYYNFFLFPLALCLRVLHTSTASSAQEHLKVPNKLMNGLLYGIFSFEKFFLSWCNFPIGVSLLGIFHKSLRD